MSFQDPVDFSSRPKGTAKIEAGDVTVRKTAFNNGSTVISVMTVHTLGLVPGDMAEITYGADEIVIRRAPRQ